jgi:hypothetical protein
MLNPVFALHIYGPSAIAVTALYLAFEFLQKSQYSAVIETVQLPPRWWQCFGVSLDQLQGCSRIISSHSAEMASLLLDVYEEMHLGEVLPATNPRANAGMSSQCFCGDSL